MSDAMFSQPIKLVVIDDNKEFGVGVNMLLANEDVEVHTAFDGPEGLKLVKQLLPDIVLLDVIMPGIDGIEVCRMIRQTPELMGVYIVMLSGIKTETDQMAEGFEAGADGYIRRPIPNRELLARLRAFIHHKKTEKALHQSEERFRVAQEMSPDGFTILHPVRNKNGEAVDFTWVYENQTVAHINGTDPQEVIGKRLLDLFPTHRGTSVFDTYLHVANTGKPQIIEEIYVGDVISKPVWLRLVVVSMGVDIAILSQDITKRKRAETQLSHQKDLMQYVIEHANSAVAINDRDLHYKYVSNVYLKQFGIKEKDIIGKHLYEVFPNLPQKWRDIHKRVLKGEVHSAERDPFDQESGKIDWTRWECRPWYEHNGSIGGIIVYTEVITDRIEKEQTLIQSEKRFKSIVEGAPDPIFIQTDLKFAYLNPAACKLFGIDSPEQLIGKPVMERFHPDFHKKIKDRIHRLNHKEESVEELLEQKFIRVDGTEVWVETAGEPINYEGKNGALVFVRDVSQRKQTEADLKKIEWMLTKKTAALKSIQDPPYGDLSKMNTNGMILDAVGKNVLKDIAIDFLRLLESSAAIYEKNGDYALGIFASGWCRFMDQASHELCDSEDNKEALTCGKWLCHDCCWKEASKPAIESGRPVDIECEGGIHLYALPIVAGDQVIGAINFGYGDPPQDKETLSKLAEKYQVPVDVMLIKAKEYESRPPYIIEMAKDRLQASASLIGEIVSRKIVEREIMKLNKELEQKIAMKTRELQERVAELERFHDATIEREFRIKQLRDEIANLKKQL